MLQTVEERVLYVLGSRLPLALVSTAHITGTDVGDMLQVRRYSFVMFIHVMSTTITLNCASTTPLLPSPRIKLRRIQWNIQVKGENSHLFFIISIVSFLLVRFCDGTTSPTRSKHTWLLDGLAGKVCCSHSVWEFLLKEFEGM